MARAARGGRHRPGAADRREPLWYAYDLPRELWPPRWGDRYRGQSQKWFAFRFTGADEDIDIAAHEPGIRPLALGGADEVLRLVVVFKRPVYQAVLDEFGALLAA